MMGWLLDLFRREPKPRTTADGTIEILGDDDDGGAQAEDLEVELDEEMAAQIDDDLADDLAEGLADGYDDNLK